eukprot:scaffold99898_cov50-Phaeocystis_antarctica.AAC.1
MTRRPDHRHSSATVHSYGFTPSGVGDRHVNRIPLDCYPVHAGLLFKDKKRRRNGEDLQTPPPSPSPPPPSAILAYSEARGKFHMVRWLLPLRPRFRGVRVQGVVGGVASSTPAAVSAQVEVRVQLTRAEGARAGTESSRGACRVREPSHGSRPRCCSRVVPPRPARASRANVESNCGLQG